MMVALLVRDYDEAIAWFRDRLGFALVEDTRVSDEKRWVVMSGGGASLLLARAATPAQAARVGDQTGGRVFLFLESGDFARDHARMQAGGVRFVEAPRQEPYGTVAVFEDLYGNRWDLIERRRARTVLLVIDLQNDFVARLADARVVERVAALVDDARRAGAPVLWVRAEYEPDLSDGFLEMRRKQIATCVRGTRGAELAIAPAEGEPVIVKKRYSAFFGTDLDAQLARLGARTLVVAGINTHACVRTTVIDAYQRDYDVIVARGAVASNDPEHGAITLRYFDGKIAALLEHDAIRW
jgi:nicotinamidase-related amidase/uncharacterized glyoxalase superfamily protein PhnB